MSTSGHLAATLTALHTALVGQGGDIAAMTFVPRSTAVIASATRYADMNTLESLITLAAGALRTHVVPVLFDNACGFVVRI